MSKETLAPQVEKLLLSAKEDYFQTYDETVEDEAVIKVGYVASRFSKFYEKIRYVLDYKEEHLLRRSAIERILKRKLVLPAFSDEEMASSFVFELVKGGYLPNNTIPEKNVEEVEKILNKMFAMLDAMERLMGNSQEYVDYYKKLLGFFATEIEFYLFPSTLNEAVVDAFYLTVKDNIQVVDTDIEKGERDLQIYLACRRSLLKSDEISLFYRFWLLYFPDWGKLNDFKNMDNFAQEFLDLDRIIQGHLSHPLSWKLTPKLKNQAIYFSLIREVIEDNVMDAEQIFQNPDDLASEVRSILENKYQEEGYKSRRSAFRAIIYVLCTKIILAFIIELPYEGLFLEGVNYAALAINVIFHPLLLFLITRSLTPAKVSNTEYVIENIKAISYGEKLKNIEIRLQRRRTWFSSVLMFMYAGIFLFSFGIIAWFLNKLDFNLVSAGLFMIFLTLVSFLGLRIRHTAKRWRVSAQKESLITVLWDVFTIPIIQVGRWLTQKFATLNIFVFVMDFILETPFKLLLEIVDSFVSFLREKKEEIY